MEIEVPMVAACMGVKCIDKSRKEGIINEQVCMMTLLQ